MGWDGVGRTTPATCLPSLGFLGVARELCAPLPRLCAPNEERPLRPHELWVGEERPEETLGS